MNNLNNDLTHKQSIANDPSTLASRTHAQPCKITMTKAAIETNRANAQKSTGPRIVAGKARSVTSR